MRRKRTQNQVQYDLFGQPIQSASKAKPPEIVPLGFEGSSVRMIVIKSRPWWVLSDVAKLLGYKHAPHAARLLRDKHKGVHLTDTPSGQQEMVIINEPGLNCLLTKSERPEAERFQDWLFEEVLPSIYRTGSYTMKPRTRVDREAKRLGCDQETAKVRCDQFAMNKAVHSNFFAGKGCVQDVTNWHDAGYQGQFGMKTRELRKRLGISKDRTPLDYMALVPLSINQHAKAIETKLVELAAKEGHPISPSERPALLEMVATQVREQSLTQIGSGATFTITVDRRRGKIIDVARPTMLEGVPA